MTTLASESPHIPNTLLARAAQYLDLPCSAIDGRIVEITVRPGLTDDDPSHYVALLDDPSTGWIILYWDQDGEHTGTASLRFAWLRDVESEAYAFKHTLIYNTIPRELV